MEKRQVKQDIINAARKVFIAKGYKGATMRDIAAEANINLAMLHYYFNSKENLFNIIFDEAHTLLFGEMVAILSANNDIFEKIRKVIDHSIQQLIAHPALPDFLFHEIAQNPDRFAQRIKKNKEVTKIIGIFQKQIRDEVEKGVIRDIEPFVLFLNMNALCVFPFLAKPIMKEAFGVDDLVYGAMLERRKKEVAELIIESIRC